MSSAERISLAEAKRIARKLVLALGPFCEHIQVAGSIRRERETIGDIELVAIPKIEHVTNVLNFPAPSKQLSLFGGEQAEQRQLFDVHMEQRRPLDAELDRMIAAGEITNELPPGLPSRPAWGERLKRFWLLLTRERGLLQVELYLTTREAFGSIFAIRTGPSDFSRDVVTHIRYKTPYVQEDGALRSKTSGQLVPTPTELHYFRAIGLPYMAPELRSSVALRYTMERAREQQ